MLYNVLRIGDGAAKNTAFLFYKLIVGTSKIVKLAILPHYCQYDVSRRIFYKLIPSSNFPPSPISTILCNVESRTSFMLFSTFEI